MDRPSLNVLIDSNVFLFYSESTFLIPKHSTETAYRMTSLYHQVQQRLITRMAKSNSGYPWLLIIPHSTMIEGKIVCINGEQKKKRL